MFVIQSAFTGAFLAPDADGVPGWVMLLTEAGQVSDYETAAEIMAAVLLLPHLLLLVLQTHFCEMSAK